MVSGKRRGRLLSAVTAGAACLTCATASSAQVPYLPGWDLVWNDEFDGTSLDTSRWEAINRQDSFNNEKQYYLADQVSVGNGLLTITATNQPIANKQYRSGLVRTTGEHMYGRWEVRANLPTTQGMWPAIWLLPDTVAWPTGGEIDIMENRGSQPYLTSSAYHWQANPGPCCGQHEYVFDEYTATENGQPVNFHESYHNYALEWEPDQMRFYVDDNLHFTVDDPQRLYEVPMTLIINLAIGGDFGGDPDGSTVWPQTFDIEYARYWQKSTAPPLQGDVNHDGFVGIADLNVLLGEWNLSAPAGVVLTDFGSFGLTGTYEQWNDGIFTSGAEDFRVQAGDIGGGWRDLGASIDADGETTLQVSLDVNAGNTSDAFNVVLIDGDGTQRVYRFLNLTVGDDQVLSIDIDDYLQDNATGSVPGLDLSNITEFHLQGTFSSPGDWLDVTFDHLSLGGAGGPVLLGDLDGDGFVGIADLNIVLGEWNQGNPPSLTIPEPTALVLLSLGGIAMSNRSVRRIG